jgi:hypothetical protein
MDDRPRPHPAPGQDLDEPEDTSFDLIVSLSPEAQHRAVG